uniref:Uncharacterized protein n=1 Tax=Anguilla anguilla TaxID=7936 RepID=A0A0E9XTN9_ANGAN
MIVYRTCSKKRQSNTLNIYNAGRLEYFTNGHSSQPAETSE